jgi:hypothetical protein
VEKYGRAGQATDDNITRRMRIACQTKKATDTRSEYIIVIAFLRQKWLRERASMSHLYVHCLSCYNQDEVLHILKPPNALVIHFNY